MDDILNHYGANSTQPQKPRASEGGCCEAKPLAYDPPKGPTSQMQQGPGLHGTNHGQSGGQQGQH